MIHEFVVSQARRRYIEILMSKPCLLWFRFQWLLVRAMV